MVPKLPEPKKDKTLGPSLYLGGICVRFHCVCLCVVDICIYRPIGYLLLQVWMTRSKVGWVNICKSVCWERGQRAQNAHRTIERSPKKKLRLLLLLGCGVLPGAYETVDSVCVWVNNQTDDITQLSSHKYNELQSGQKVLSTAKLFKMF